MKGAVALLVWAGAAAAEDDGAAIAVLEACLEGPGPEVGCIGAAAGLCAATEGRQGGVGICYGLENAYWEEQVDRVMDALTAPGVTAEAFAERVNWPIPQPSLAAVQVAFEAYRDAACDMEGALWGNGSGAGPAWMACRMRVTAEHALRLDAWLEDLE